MSLHNINSPVGIDISIKKIQNSLYASLGWANYESYARVYKNKKDDLVIPEFYLGNKNYKEVLMNDKVSATSFFIVADDIAYNELALAKVSLIIQCDLKALYPSITHRADEEMHQDVVLILEKYKFGKLTAITTGIEKVYSDLKINIDYTDDMQEFHVVKFDLEIGYSYNC